MKDKLLAIVCECVAAGWTTERACSVLEVDRRRVWRWQRRRDSGEGLEDRSPGGNPVHALLGWEVEDILALAEQWGPTDRSHRKPAHRGSSLQRVWVAPSTVRRVLAAADVNLPAAPPRPAPRQRRPWLEWVQYRPNQVWGHDVTRFSRCRAAPNCFAVIDLVSRKWICALLSPEETATQTQALFLDALEAENLIGAVEDRLDTAELPTPSLFLFLFLWLALCRVLHEKDTDQMVDLKSCGETKPPHSHPPLILICLRGAIGSAVGA